MMRLPKPREINVITCYLRYIIDPFKVDDFERYAMAWIPLVEKFGGTHHGYFLPHEGPNNVAVALFSFPSLADYEKYRSDAKQDEACLDAWKIAEDTRCIVSFERTFLRPVLGDGRT